MARIKKESNYITKTQKEKLYCTGLRFIREDFSYYEVQAMAKWERDQFKKRQDADFWAQVRVLREPQPQHERSDSDTGPE